MNEIPWKKISQFKGPQESPGFLLWKVSTFWRRHIEAALQTLELTHPQFVLLASIGWLNQNNHDITQAELAHWCSTDINMTSQVLRTLEKKGFIERYYQDGNAKSKFSKITKKGTSLLEKAIPLVEKVDHDFFSKLKTKKQTCIEVLSLLTD